MGALIEKIKSNRDQANFIAAFLSMLIFPVSVFLYSRELDDNKCNIYGAILAVITVYSIIWIYIITYYLEDFRSVFCKKKVEAKTLKTN